MPDREWRSFIADMIEFCEKVVAYTDNMTIDQFAQDQLTYDATMWNIRQIGQAASNMPAEVQKANPNIQWRQIIGMRNRLTHAYTTIDVDVVWDAVQTDIPQLLTELRQLVKHIDE